MIKRIWIYIREMLPPIIHIPFTLLLFLAMFSMVHVITGISEAAWSFYLLLGYTTLLLVMLSMRIADEFKDEATDAVLFPQRPYPRGDVRKKDLLILGFTCIAAMLLLNSWHLWLIIAILIVLFYEWLTFKWFFMADKMRNSLFLALISHQPMTLLVNFYLILFLLILSGFELEIEHLPIGNLLLLALLLWMPIIAWETSRKVRAPGNETDYITYSKLIGPVNAALLPLGFLLAGVAITVHYHFIFDFHWSHLAILVLLVLTLVVFYFRFIMNPIPKNNKIKTAAELFSALWLLNLTVHAFIKISHT